MLSLKIALRYLVARKSHNAVNVITAISVMGVMVAVAAMTVVLSVYNGFDELAHSRLSRLDAPLQITRADGRVIVNADSLAAALTTRADVAAATPAIEERALMVIGSSQTPVVFKAVAADYNSSMLPLDSVMLDGLYAPADNAGTAAVQVSVGIANALGVIAGTTPMSTLYVPRRVGRINPANPAAAFRAADAVVSGVFAVEQSEIDADHIIIPIDVARDLLAYDNEATSVEVRPAPATTPQALQKSLAGKLGKDYSIKTRVEQRAEAFRMISVEKWMTFMMLIFVMAIALFNIVSTISLLIIEKRANMHTLRALGATRRQVRGVFGWQGMLITVAGGVLGIVLGVALSLAQQYGHFIKLGDGSGNTVIDWYPVRVDATDLLVVAAAVLVMGALMAALSHLLARRAAR